MAKKAAPTIPVFTRSWLIDSADLWDLYLAVFSTDESPEILSFSAQISHRNGGIDLTATLASKDEETANRVFDALSKLISANAVMAIEP